ncbi:MAG: patatin-like phospholipase family protein [Fimbriimonadaceae bacterium]|nr:patatin-like phospholipase family protein [Fimbriimonadaceae bacterium]
MRRWWLLGICCLTMTLAAEGDRPRIGLALGGGGARGLAHVGVLQWLEANRIPVDYVAGTSMGGIVGAMYAMGHTPDELQALLGEMDWTALLQPMPSYGDRSFRRKEDAREYSARLELGLRGGVRTPQGLNAGHPVGLFFSRLAWPFGVLDSFDSLPTPFRCVATDLLDGQAVVLDKGSLPEAMRATMAIPGVFTPVEREGRLLADGALLNNVPTSVLQQMGADIIIAVDVGTPLGDRESLNSLTGVVGQAVGVMIIQNVRASLGLANVALVPDLVGYSSSNYGAVGELIPKGRAACEQKAGDLLRFSVDETTWAQRQAARAARRPSPPVSPTFLQVEAAPATSQQLATRFDRYLEQPVDLRRLEADLGRLYGEGRYARLGYDAVRRDGTFGLRIRAVDKTTGPPFLNTGLNLAGGTSNEFEVSLRARLTALGVGGWDSEWRTDVSIGSTFSLASEYYRPFSGSDLFLAPRAFVTNDRSGLYRAESQIASLRTERIGGGLDLGLNLGRRSELRLGVEYANVNSGVSVGDPTLPRFGDATSRVRLRYVYDSHDDPYVPTRGWRAETELSGWTTALGGEQAMLQWQAQVSAFQRLGRGSLLQLGRIGSSFDKTAPTYATYTLGGPLRLSAYDQDVFRGSHYVYGALGYLHPLGSLPPLLGGRYYLGSWYELGSACERLGEATFRHSLSAGLVGETILGPAAIAASLGEGGNRQVYFAIGNLF